MELEVYQAMGRRIKEPLLHLHSSQSVLGNMSQISTMFPILDVDGSSKAPENRRSSPQQKTVWRRAGVQGSGPLKRHVPLVLATRCRYGCGRQRPPWSDASWLTLNAEHSTKTPSSIFSISTLDIVVAPDTHPN